MSEWLITLRYDSGVMFNSYAQFAHENPTKEEIDKFIQKNKINTRFINAKYVAPTIIFMQKLYRI
jgi:hypothetical protein